LHGIYRGGKAKGLALHLCIKLNTMIRKQSTAIRCLHFIPLNAESYHYKYICILNFQLLQLLFHVTIITLIMNKWIIFIHRIEQGAPNLRVKVWRNLKKYGAVLFRNAVYILPYSSEHEEIMQWLCKLIKDNGNEASVFITESPDKKQDEEIIKTFRDVCGKEYTALSEHCDNILKRIENIERTEGITESVLHDLNQTLREIAKNVDEISKVDFFNAPQKGTLSQKIQLIRNKLEKRDKKQKKEMTDIHKVYRKEDFTGKKWATRKGVFIDRIASAWLISRFIDPKARFVFLSKGEKTGDAIPFDMYSAEFTHHGEDCTFETLIKMFELKDPALKPIAEIVHDIDLKDEKYGRKEAEGVGQVISGLSQSLKEDKKVLEKGFEVFDALYQTHSGKHENIEKTQ